MPCFPGTTLSRIIAISCRRLASCSTLCRLNPNALYTTCIIIDLQQPSQECFPTIHTPKAMLKNSSCGPDTAIDGPGPSIKYTGCTKCFDALGLMKLPKIAPLLLPRDLANVVANDSSKLSMINKSGGISFTTFSLLHPGGISFGTRLIPGPATIVLSWVFNYFYGLGGPYLKTV